jgi:hypothetical protein
MPDSTPYAPFREVKERTFENGSIVSLSCHVPRMIEWLKANANSAGYVNLTLSRRKEEDKYGNTHYVKLYVSKSRQDAQPTRTETPAATQETDDNIPF